MISNVKFLFRRLNHRQKLRFFSLLVIMIFSSLFEILSIISLIKYVDFLGTENFNIKSDLILSFIPENSIEITLQNFSIYIVLIFFISSIFSLLTVYLSSKFSLQTGGEIENELFQYYLKRGYLYHLDTTSSKLLNNIFELVKRMTNFVLYPLMLIISKLIFIMPLIIGLFIWKTKVTLLASFVFLGLYLFFYQIFRKKIYSLGLLQTKFSEEKYSILSQGFGGIKDVKIFNKFNYFLKIYKVIYTKLVSIEVQKDIIGKFPKSIIEFTIIFFTVFLIILFQRNSEFNFNSLILNMSFFLISAYKLIPALQQVYYNINVLKNHSSVIKSLSKDLSLSKEYSKIKNEKVKKNFLTFDNLVLKNLNFKYPNAKNNTLNKITLEIKFGQKIAITGHSGSGKSTLVNIILGLINCSSGKILINGKLLKKNNLIQWQNLIGYVPQSVFITDKSISENIAFGVEKKDIDHKKIQTILKICKLDKIVKEMPKKEKSSLGERGIKFSGGQQQRLGIARALYKNPSILVLDESTNALDLKTERELLKSIYSFKKDITILLISHRIEIIKNFDKILFLEKGKISGFDKYNKLLSTNINFKDLNKQEIE